MSKDVTLPNIDETQCDIPTFDKFKSAQAWRAPRILLLYGSLRKRAFSRLVIEELMKFTLLLRNNKDYFVDRYSERVETSEQLSQRVNQRSI